MVARGLVALGLVGLAVACRPSGAEPHAAREGDRPAAPAPNAGPAPCPAGEAVGAAGRCVPAAQAFTAPGARTFWVDQRHPAASDASPGTRERPWRTVSRAARAGVLRPGDAVMIRAGVYREAVEPRAGGRGPDARVTFAAYPGDRVVVSGAEPADDGWTRDGAAWRRAWDGPPLSVLDDAEVAFRRELLVAGGVVLRPVARRADVAPGTFWVEGPSDAPRAVVARFPGDRAPAQAGGIELGRRSELFRPLGDDPWPACGDAGTPGYFRVVGLTFRHTANPAQIGAVCFGSRGALVEDVTVEWTNGRGLDGSGRRHTFRRVAANHHGQIGIGAACDSCLFEDTETAGNNWKGHDPGWEAGGGKWFRTRNTTIRRHLARDNEGPGIWFDIDNRSNTIEDSRAENNVGAGIMLELATTRTLVQHNVVTGTRWWAYTGSGILSQAASHNALVHNTVTGNAGSGIWLRRDPDGRAPEGRYVVANNLVRGNATGRGAPPDYEAREAMVEAASPAELGTHHFAGNGWGRRLRDDLRFSTFYAWPDPPHEAGFRGGDLGDWQRLLGDAGARLVGPREATPPAPALPGGLGGLGGFGAAGTRVRAGSRLGADAGRAVPG